MWLNDKQVVDSAVSTYRNSLFNTCPNYVVIDNLFDEPKLEQVMALLHQPGNWKTQKHTYSALYVDDKQWQKTSNEERFVQRDVWQRNLADTSTPNIAQDFLAYLRGDEFMAFLSRIFNVRLTDVNVAEPEVNTNFFRLGTQDFVEQHADGSPGREVCMLLYLNKDWAENAGGELVFIGPGEEPIRIAPIYNRCVLFDPSSTGSEHWVEKLNAENTDQYRYNVTAWYWSE